MDICYIDTFSGSYLRPLSSPLAFAILKAGKLTHPEQSCQSNMLGLNPMEIHKARNNIIHTWVISGADLLEAPTIYKD